MKDDFQIKKFIDKINKVYECLKCPSLSSKTVIEINVTDAKRALDEIRDDINKEWNELLLLKELRSGEQL